MSVYLCFPFGEKKSTGTPGFILGQPGVPVELGRLIKCPWGTGRVEQINISTILLAEIEHSLQTEGQHGLLSGVKPQPEGRQTGSLPN